MKPSITMICGGVPVTGDRRRARGGRVLRGRDVQLGVIGEALAEMTGTPVGSSLVETPPAVGKSSVLAEPRGTGSTAGGSS
jgi:hypothetical protein